MQITPLSNHICFVAFCSRASSLLFSPSLGHIRVSLWSSVHTVGINKPISPHAPLQKGSQWGGLNCAFADPSKGDESSRKGVFLQVGTFLKIKKASRNVFGSFTHQLGLGNNSLCAGLYLLLICVCGEEGAQKPCCQPVWHCTPLPGFWIFSCPCEK